ncbi:hypothetical protein EDD27_7772 [Nonomuraea polychroma]|uniref:Short subunit dehydrogenase n=1 Tax=Nonomuraea polychroma TaxID=46176 RepID=A0A438MH65_9ACTN|nr:hypothetical protein [Nonomuraea polychroma]RVX44996.1 hypothetical protein EDD27_7772 [Nonomuraea polychroma]
MANAGVMAATGDAAANSWRRLVGHMFRAFASGGAPIPPIPDAPTSAALYRADLRRLTAGTASYSDSKLWVTALALAIASRWKGTSSHVVDPGWVPTRMGGAGAPDDLTAGHQTQVWLATHHDVTPGTGGYWYHQQVQTPHPAAQDEDFQARLIQVLESHTGVPLD